ncbi:MAG: gamma-glutamyltransferase [Saprospiraceae bacterium]|nr:gamma-glutamyltransferase [Saprospiraceae bacterium]
MKQLSLSNTWFFFGFNFVWICFTTAELQAQTLAEHGMVVSSNSLASQIGVDILKRGGNAIDASVATAFALAVIHPEAGNIGGGGFLVFMNDKGAVSTIDFREKAPLASNSKMFIDRDGKVMKDEHHNSIRAVGVPGTVAGLYLAHSKYGRLPWKELLQPAINLAKNGIAMSWGLYKAAKQIVKSRASIPFMRNYFKNGKDEVTKPGDLWKQPALANTLTLIRDKGHDGFYSGPVAQEIAQFMEWNGGLITIKDLQKYKAIERQAIHGTYRGFDIYSIPPPSSGGIGLIGMLNMVEVARLDTFAFNSAGYVHSLAEIMRRSFADRAAFLGDPDYNTDLPIEKLISKDYAKSRLANLDMEKASISDSARFGQIYEGDNTTHFSVVDKDGNAVALTYTLEYSYGSGLGSEKLGFIFNNEMGDFNPEAGVTNTSGQIGTLANLIAPEKRMLSSMTPAIVAKDGKPYLIIGSPGGRTIINTVFQTVLCVLAYKMPIDKAIEAMKIHHQWLPDVLTYEKHLMSPDTRIQLEKMGHRLRAVDNLGSLMGILYDPEYKIYTGAADSSSPDGGVVGY